MTSATVLTIGPFAPNAKQAWSGAESGTPPAMGPDGRSLETRVFSALDCSVATVVPAKVGVAVDRLSTLRRTHDMGGQTARFFISAFQRRHNAAPVLWGGIMPASRARSTSLTHRYQSPVP